MKLSIIVPVYNVEKHLVRCLESVAHQMCDDYELILVDDGSTDHSGVLCDEFARSHAHLNVVVLHQHNGGLSAARNRGLEEARGEYVTFVDSDDHIDAQTLVANMAYLLAHPEVDMLEYPIEIHAESSQAHILTFQGETRNTEIFVDWVRRGGYKHCYACNKIYASRLWEGMHFPQDTYFEDVAIMPAIIHRCRCLHYSNIGCYRYVMHPGSITTSYRYSKQRALFEGNHRLYMEVKENSSLQAESLQLWVYCLNQLVDMGRCMDVDKTDYAHVLCEADKHHPSYGALLKVAPRAMTKLKLLPLPLLGLRTYCRLYVLFTKPLLP